ncbi:hypothetical protein D0T53_02205 [Dysgonomonas sp. 216]|uniref:type IX secretion system anionic LPS delivery protein PorZ n=1 Tax=Dysgonomonas sp. 216 TaxID=2302934 RepID=UPI0013D52F80|nr:hypothetical protein [Dysgonomonas sp. 216]NDW17727.1 hypothetical protein [Dysgonomonas sp. 216]
MKKNILTIILLTTTLLSAFSQKMWNFQTHFSYEGNIETLALGDDIVFAVVAEQNKSGYYDTKLFSYSPSDDLTDTYVKTIGSDAVAQIAYSKKHKCLISISENSDIDLIYSSSNIVNIPDLKNLSANLDKKVNHIFINDDYAYLSTNFGLLVLNIAKQEIKESVIFRYTFNSSVLYNGLLYVATSQGVMTVDPTKNIQFPENWEKFELSNKYVGSSWTFSDEEINEFLTFDNKLIFLIKQKGVYSFDGTSANMLPAISEPLKMLAENNRLIISTSYRFWDFANLSEAPREVSIDANNLRNIVPHSDKQNRYWAAFDSKNLSLIEVNNEGQFEEIQTGIRPSGPLSNLSFKMAQAGGKLLLVGGYYTNMNSFGMPGKLSEFENNKWYNYDKAKTDAASGGRDSRDFIYVIANPKDPNNVFVATWNQEGLYEFKNKEYKFLHDEKTTGGVLSKFSATDSRMRINSLVFDSKNRLWLSNKYISPTLPSATGGVRIKVLLNPGDDTPQWKSIEYSEIADLGSNNQALAIDKYNNKWLGTAGDKNTCYIFVFNENGDIDNVSVHKTKLIGGNSLFYDQDGALLSIKRIQDLKEDASGNIWVGTDIGVFVIYNSSNIFNKSTIPLNKIKIPRNDGTNNADILLENIRVNAICVDGGNRKWLATPVGVYCVSANGYENLYHFTMDNSPMPSNNVLSLAIDSETGVVYIGTEKGLVSFKAEATAGSDSYSNVYTYPNPVHPDYDGPITITGLKANSTVKITDVRGNLINQGISIGGQYLWDGRNVGREKVDTGVYLVFGSSEDGKDGVVTKIMVVN